jgi:hypothetical protein
VGSHSARNKMGRAKVTPLVVYSGTIASTNRKGATAEVSFEGNNVFWFSTVLSNGGAAVSIDGESAEIMDAYSAEIRSVWVCRKQLSQEGCHTVRIEVLDDRNPQSKDTLVTVDGHSNRPAMNQVVKRWRHSQML